MTLREVSAGIAISGLFDLEPIRLNYLNDKLGLDAAEALRNSPILNLPPMAAPLVTAYGTAELPELCRQSVDYAQAWAERGLPGSILPIDGADHFTALEAFADPKGALTEALVALRLELATGRLRDGALQQVVERQPVGDRDGSTGLGNDKVAVGRN